MLLLYLSNLSFFTGIVQLCSTPQHRSVSKLPQFLDFLLKLRLLFSLPGRSHNARTFYFHSENNFVISFRQTPVDFYSTQKHPIQCQAPSEHQRTRNVWKRSEVSRAIHDAGRRSGSEGSLAPQQHTLATHCANSDHRTLTLHSNTEL